MALQEDWPSLEEVVRLSEAGPSFPPGGPFHHHMYEMEIFVVLDVTKVVERGNGQGRESNPRPLAP